MTGRLSTRQQIESLEQRVLFSTITVNTLADETIANSTTSLREAIAKAASGDTIQFGVTGTIQLNPTELAINKNLTITGPGASKLTIRGTASSRIFNVASSKTLNLNGVTITNGHGADSGGAILNAGILNLNGCTFSNNHTVAFASGSTKGGAIRCLENTTLTASGCTFTSNSADSRGAGDSPAGGAIYSDSNITLSNCTLSANKADYGDGGAIYLATHGTRNECTLSDCTINFNGCFEGGGAIDASSANMTISNCSFAQNSAPQDSGGAIEIGGLLRISGATFDDNEAAGYGGAVSATGELIASDVVFTNNFSEYIGGGLSLTGTDGNSSITRCTFKANSVDIAPGNGGGLGGGMYVNGNTLAVTDSVFTQNQSQGLGSGLTLGNANVSFTRCTISANGTVSAQTGGGGGLFSTKSTVSLYQSTVAGNVARFAAGAGIRIPDGSITITSSTVSGNIAEPYSGSGVRLDAGGMYIGAGATAKLYKATFALNRAIYGNAAAILDDGGYLLLSSCTVSSNAALSGITGGISARSGSPLYFANSIVAGNGGSIAQDVSGAAVSSGFNVIGEADGSSGWISSDQRGTRQAPLDPGLTKLANNGGPTQTMSPVDWSPVIDAGKSFGLTTDQRGSKRTVDFSSVRNASGGDGTDIGALERQTAPVKTQFPFPKLDIGVGVGKIEAENFDFGREGDAYHDSDPTNNGGELRTTGVDIETCTDPGGMFDIASTRAGEWVEYTVNVLKSGLYDVGFRVANTASGASLHLESDGANITGAVAVPNTGGAWQTVTKKQVALTAGTHVLRLAFDKGAANLSAGAVNYFTFTPVGTITTDTSAFVLDGGHASSNFGLFPELEVKKSTVGYNRESYLKFDISTIGTLNSAKLLLFGRLASSENPSINLLVNDASSNWNENTITWNNRPPAQQFIASFTVTGTNAKWYEIDVTNYLKAAKAAGKTTVTFVIRSAQTTTAVCNFNSDDNYSSQPHLVIT